MFFVTKEWQYYK